jgi:membrane protein DedA with SNARE-associated domain
MYAAAAASWIILSSIALHSFVNNIDTFKNIEIYKGIIFVIITSLILFIYYVFVKRKMPA